MILQRYILRQILLTFFFSFALIMGVFLIVMCFQVFRSYSSLGLDILLRMIPLAAANAASWAILVSTCPAATLVYGRLSADNEIDAMRISGIATRRIVLPGLVFGIVLSLAQYGVVEWLSPEANFRRRVMLREFSVELLKAPPPGKQRFSFGPLELTYLDAVDGVLQAPYIVKMTPEGKAEIEYTAPVGRVNFPEGGTPQLILTRPSVISHDPGGSGRVTLGNAGDEMRVDLSIESIIDAKPRPDHLHADDLWKAIQEEKNLRRRHWLETVYWGRYAQGAAPLLLLLVSVPLGILVRRGSRLAGLGTALPPLGIYLLAYFPCQGMGENGRLAPTVAAFVADAILLVMGAVLLWRVGRK